MQASANVFADIGLDHPEQTLIRAKLMAYVIEIIKERHLTSRSAADLLVLQRILMLLVKI
ncbi:MAG: XRE family transcriptional regulator [Candidatus Omnitrophica bacterium]|nr:XRE family transcriptional regulator [Candidatus Omnitrophota bacterium]